MYAQRSRCVKTDRRDAEALAYTCRLRTYHPAHRTSDAAPLWCASPSDSLTGYEWKIP
jgi:hypothetical protein